jgi:phosphonate transport system substrate-binding protein
MKSLSRLSRRLFCAGFACLAISCSQESNPASGDAKTSAKPKVLRFSAIPDQDKKNLEKFNAIASHLAKELNIGVEYVPSPDYATSVTSFKNGDIHLAWFGGLTGVQARAAVPGATAIAQGDIDPAFIAYLIAHRDAGLQPSAEFPKQIGALKFTFGEPQSTSGRLMPQFFIESAMNQPVDQFFVQGINFSKGHDATCEVVQSGAVQAGFVNSTVYDKRVKEGKTDPALVSVIWKTPPFADYNWTAHPDLEGAFGAGFTAKLQQAIIDITTKAPALLEVFPRKAMIPTTNETYDGIADVAKKLGFLK